jgi:heptosyltransferase-2
MISLAFIQRVLDKFPTSTVDLIVKKGFQTIPLPHRGKILSYDKKSTSAFSFGRTLKPRAYDRAYILPPSFSAALMVFSAKIPERIGYKGYYRSFLLSPAQDYQQTHRTEHLVREYLHLLAEPVKDKDLWPHLKLTEDWIAEKTAGINIDQQTICLAPGAMYGPAKQWPISYFQQVALALIKQGERVVIVGTTADQAAGETIVAGHSAITNLCGKTDLIQLIAILAKSKMLLSNDSGAMHIMAALQKPQIAIFGSTSPVWTGPMNKRAELVSVQMDCTPCYSRKCPQKHYNCQKMVTPEIVLTKIEDLLRL